MKDQGILLCAVGSKKYYDLCNTIIRDIKEVMPNVSIAVYTDNKGQISDADIFIDGVHNPNLIFLSKIKACQASPFEKTIFIDVDSRVLRPVDHLFKILNTHDLGLGFANSRKQLSKDDWDPNAAGLPLSSSTLLFKKNKQANNLFETWKNEYKSQERFPGHGDQFYLHFLIYYDNDIRYFTLPDEYRFNIDHPTFVAGSVKILTGLISDVDYRGKYSRKRLDNIFNPPGVYERTIYTKLLGGSKWKIRTNFLPKRIIIKTINKAPISRFFKPAKSLFFRFLK